MPAPQLRALLFCSLLLTEATATRIPEAIGAAAQRIELELVVSGLNSPVYVTNAHDGSNRLFILEQAGIVKVLQAGSQNPAIFLDIRAKVLSGGERGLLGLAFHPAYATNRRFFVNYTRRSDGATVISEYLVSSSDPNAAETNETIILTIAQPFSNHNGGMIEFGPDGFLYIGMGDGGSANDPGNRAQNIEDLLGKMLRIDVDRPASATQPYSSPSSNPFFGSIPGRDEIFALGLRNPWRFSFDRQTGEIYAGDVGQNAIEEIDIVTLGGNYGWRVFEGTRCTELDPSLCPQSGYIRPIAEYGLTGGRCSVIGGYVYRGTRSSLPPGSYVYGDYCSGEISLLENGAVSLLLDTNLRISSFGEDERGEIYVVGLSGTIHRIVEANALVSIIIQMSKTTFTNGETVTATEFRLRNPGAEAAKVEAKVWLRIPGLAPVSILNLGSDGTFSLPAGLDQNLGPVTLFTVTSNSVRGSYEFSSRLVDPVTGKIVNEDLNTFLIE